MGSEPIQYDLRKLWGTAFTQSELKKQVAKLGRQTAEKDFVFAPNRKFHTVIAGYGSGIPQCDLYVFKYGVYEGVGRYSLVHASHTSFCIDVTVEKSGSHLVFKGTPLNKNREKKIISLVDTAFFPTY